MPLLPHTPDADADTGACAVCELPAANQKMHPPSLSARTSKPQPVRAYPPAQHYSVAAAGLDSPATTLAAAEGAETTHAQLRARLRHLLATLGPLTDAEMEAKTQRSHQSVSAARRSLVLNSYVEPAMGPDGAPVTRPTASGRQAITWQLTDLGRALAGAA